MYRKRHSLWSIWYYVLFQASTQGFLDHISYRQGGASVINLKEKVWFYRNSCRILVKVFKAAFLNLKWNFDILASSILCLIHILSNCWLAFSFLYIYVQMVQISSTKKVRNSRGISYILDFEFCNFFDPYDFNSIFVLFLEERKNKKIYYLYHYKSYTAFLSMIYWM